MRIDKNELIAGQPILHVRDCLRPFRGSANHIFGKGYIAERLKISERKAGQITRELKARGWIDLVEDQKRYKGFYTLTMKGNAFTGARAITPINRAKAEKLLADFLKRVDMVNERDELVEYVHEVHVFGSYMNKKVKDLGDIDLAIETHRRQVPGRDHMKYMEERAFELGAENRSWMDRLLYVELEAQRILKARNPYISLHPLSDLKATGSKSKLLYRWKGER